MMVALLLVWMVVISMVGMDFSLGVVTEDMEEVSG